METRTGLHACHGQPPRIARSKPTDTLHLRTRHLFPHVRITFVLLGLAILGVWLPSWQPSPRIRIATWAVLHAAAVLSGLIQGLLTWPALLPLSALAWLCLGAKRHTHHRHAWAWTWAVGVVSLTMALHAWPGFHNPKLLDEVRSSPHALPFTLYANFDKASAGLFLLVFFAPRLRTFEEARAIILPTALASLVTAALTLGLAWATGHVRPDIKVPAFTATFLAVNLLFTCVAEEAFFRGLIQQQLSGALALRPNLAWLPVVASTLLFTLAHAGGPVPYLACVAVAGLAYGLVQARTGRLEAATLTHFAVNAAHFLLFTYPAKP